MPDKGDSTIFSSSDQSTTEANTQNQNQQNGGDTASQLALLVGEGRKYRTVEDLAKAYIHVDGFVETLKGETAELREKLASAKTVDDVLERLKADPGTNADQRGKTGDSAKSGLSAADVAAIVRDQIVGVDAARVKEANLRKADALMRQAFGEKAKDVFAKEATTLEMRKALVDLAAVHPEKFVAVFAPAKASGSQVDGSSSINTAALEVENQSGRAVDPNCKEFYNALRKKDPKAYYSSAIQLQMHNAALANRDKYFGRSS